MATDSVLDALKVETRSLHEQLESRVDMVSRLKSPEAYRQLLEAFYGFYAPVESRLAECVGLRESGLDFGARSKVSLLVRDLQRVGVGVDGLPRCAELPAIESAAEGFGCLYVLEGATLGSQIIKRLLAQQLGISAENGGAFFNAYGDRVGMMWEGFRQTLAQYAERHPEEREAIVGGARETFLTLDAWFSRCLS